MYTDYVIHRRVHYVLVPKLDYFQVLKYLASLFCDLIASKALSLGFYSKRGYWFSVCFCMKLLL